ncbi:transposable element Tcb1 transposase [Trichonephila clavipes]|nr:transposable element Tcb1 transposase [Trichonephila clavipes]
MAVNDRLASSRQLAARCSNATVVLMPASPIRRRLLHLDFVQECLYKGFPTLRIRVRRYAGERCLPECVLERHSNLIPEVMIWVRFRIMDDPICYELRSNTCNFFLVLLIRRIFRLLSMWDLIGRHLARAPHHAALKDERFLRIQYGSEAKEWKRSDSFPCKNINAQKSIGKIMMCLFKHNGLQFAKEHEDRTIEQLERITKIPKYVDLYRVKRKEKEYNINRKYAKLDNFLISASSSSCASASSSTARELDEQILEMKINTQEKNTVSDTSTIKNTQSKEKKSENENEDAKFIKNDFAHYVGTPIDGNLREQILKLGPYQPQGNFQKRCQGKELFILLLEFQIQGRTKDQKEIAVLINTTSCCLL